ncbi:hypothetical protein [Levilactobacillus sp. HBUAS70063]|uniref:hypothetical protein n=1 Tax=Levilactobacillus sp. HBUAS70063 TaxID=3109359 RepID=UPI0031332812
MYDKLYGRQQISSISEPATLDTAGEPLQTGSRYWVVDDGDREAFIYDSLIDVDNYLENFSDSGHDVYFNAVLALYGYCPEARRITYLGDGLIEEVK